MPAAALSKCFFLTVSTITWQAGSKIQVPLPVESPDKSPIDRCKVALLIHHLYIHISGNIVTSRNVLSTSAVLCFPFTIILTFNSNFDLQCTCRPFCFFFWLFTLTHTAVTFSHLLFICLPIYCVVKILMVYKVLKQKKFGRLMCITVYTLACFSEGLRDQLGPTENWATCISQLSTLWPFKGLKRLKFWHWWPHSKKIFSPGC